MGYLRIGDNVPSKGRGSKLTAKMLLFVEAYVDPNGPGFQNATQSVIVAGYKTDAPNKLGVQLAQNPLVVDEIKRRMEAREKRLDLTADYVLHKLMTLAEETVRDSDRIRALELLGKTLALFKERQEISGPDGAAIAYEQKVQRDVADFTSSIARLTERGGKGELIEFPKREEQSGT